METIAKVMDVCVKAGMAEIRYKERAGQGKTNGVELAQANGLWAQKDYKFRKEYFDLVTQNYGAGVENLDFKGATEEARKTINAWVEKQTKDKVKELLTPGIITQLTRLVLTNAIYFKGEWETQFEKGKTKNEAFTMADGTKADVPTMHGKLEASYGEGEGFQMLELPYKGRELSMVVYLPNKADGIAELEGKLTAGDFAARKFGGELWRLHSREVEVALPKFKMTSEFRLDETLKAMGMKDAFGDADFSGMTGGKELSIGAVVHKAYVEVNEEGTEAAAATAVVMEGRAATAVPVFRADHPFLFVIRDVRTGSVLFMGRVMDPRG